jgi:hypothetical protein
LLQLARVGDEGVVQVSHIVIDRAAAGGAPDDGHAVRVHEIARDFFLGVLVQTDDDRIRVLPENQPLAFELVFKHVFFKSQIPGGIRAVCFKIIQYCHFASPPWTS